ncbi:MAG: aromatic ring-hydroxylating dioxygenase subunit alpha, partial [Sphingomonadales bacterium]
NRTTVEYFMLTPTAPPSPKVEDLFARSYDLIRHVFGNEDFRAAEISQEGLSSGALDEVIYGGMEITIPAYYDRLDACLADQAQ